MTYSWDEINDIISARRRNDSWLKRGMIDIRDRVNGDLFLPLYNVEGEPITQSMAPQLVADAIDGTARRAASTLPNIWCPPVNGAQARSRARSHTRKRALQATWAEARMGLALRRAFRHLAGYGTCALVVCADVNEHEVEVELRDPLTAYPEPRSPEDIDEPDNVGFVVGRTTAWCASHYPYDSTGRDLRPMWRQMEQVADIVDIVEWIDPDDIVIGCLGPRQDRGAYETPGSNFELKRGPNRAGMVPVVSPCTVTLDRIATAVSRIVPAVDMLDRLTALNTIAAEKAVFPDRYIMTRDGRSPQVIGNRWKDGREGETNLISNADAIGELNTLVNPGAVNMMSNLERNARLSSGNPAALSGEMSGSVRSGQTINALGSFAVDPAVAEMQEVMASWLGVLNEGIIATYKGYFGRRRFSMYSGKVGDTELIEFTPADDFDSDANVVTYSWPGQDINGVTVAIAQLVGAKMMSLDSARSRHPLIDDADHESTMIEVEALEEALLSSLQQAAASGTLPAVDLARIQQLKRDGKDLAAAVVQAQEEAQKRQASHAAPPGPGEAVAPGTQPGLAAPGQGVEQQPPADVLPAPQQSLQNFQELVGALRRPQVPAGAR